MNKIDQRKFILLLGMLFFLGMGLWMAQNQSITLDESTSILIIYKSIKYDLSYVTQDIHMMAYSYFLYLWLMITGVSTVSAKMFSLIPSVLTLVFSYRLVCRYAEDERMAKYTFLLLAFSPLLLQYGITARTYAFFVMGSCWSSWSYLKFQKEPGRGSSVKHLLATIFFIHTHPLAFIQIFFQTVHLLLWSPSKEKIKAWVGIHVRVAILFLPVLKIIFDRFELTQALPNIYSWVPEMNFERVLGLVDYLTGNNLLITQAYLVLVIFSIFLIFRKKITFFESYLLLWAFTPFIVVSLYSLIWHSVFIYRGLAPAIVPLAILASYGICQLKIKAALREVCVGIIILILSIHSWQHFDKDPEGWSEVSNVIGQDLDGQKIYFSPAYVRVPFLMERNHQCLWANDIDQCLLDMNLHLMEGQIPIDEIKTSNLSWLVSFCPSEKIFNDLRARSHGLEVESMIFGTKCAQALRLSLHHNPTPQKSTL